MSTSWKSQQGKGEYALQFETDDEGKYKLVEKAAQMAMDGKTADDFVEVKHGEWIYTGDTIDIILDTTYSEWKCSECGYIFCGDKMNSCHNCGAKMDGGKT